MKEGDWEPDDDSAVLRLETADGSWVTPSRLLLGETYEPAVSDDTDVPSQELQAAPWFTDETVAWNSGIFDEAGADALRGGPRYVSSQYLTVLDDLEVPNWREFLRELGVDSILQETHTIGALGELYVKLQLEVDEVVNVSRATIGRDLDVKSVSDSEGRIIEVKSTKESSGDFELQPEQTALLNERTTQYEVYRVTNVLTADPTVRYADGETALDAGSFRLEISSRDWRSDSTRLETRDSY